MSRLIDADLLGLTDMEIIMCDGDYKEALRMLIDKIEHAPTIEERKTGEWIVHQPFEDGHKNCNVCIECSCCRTWFGHDCYAETNFCPNCGADMKGEQNEQT